MENIRIDKKNISFSYAEKLAPNRAWERKFANNINLWLGQYADTINHQEGVIQVFFDTDIKQHIQLENMQDDLKSTLHQQLALFQAPRHRIEHSF